MRKMYDKAFKAKLALEALRGDKTIQELGQLQIENSFLKKSTNSCMATSWT